MEKLKNEDKDPNIQQLVETLGSKNGLERKKARKALVGYGKVIINPLLELLDHPKYIFRWEALMTLKEIRDQTLIPVFISKLDDDESEIRWIAAEGLIKQEKYAIIPLLKFLEKNSDSVFALEGSHHVFNDLHKHKKLPGNFPYDKIMPLLKSTSMSERIKIAIYQILHEIKET